MWSLGALVSVLLAAGAAASPVKHTYVHEKRNLLNVHWNKHEEMDKELVLPLKIALKQSNLHMGEEWLMDVSDPASKNFGKHWDARQVIDAFKPKDETVEAVKTWLINHGIEEPRISLSDAKSFVNVNARVEEIETLLNTKFHWFKHGPTENWAPACDEYHIPHELEKHVDFVTPTVHFDARLRYGNEEPDDVDRILEKRQRSGPPGPPGRRGGWSHPFRGRTVNPAQIIMELSNCDQYITPVCLEYLYEFPPKTFSNKGNSYGIVEYTPESYIGSDLDMFFRNFSPNLIGDRPIFDSIDGGVLYTDSESFGLNGESDLDLEYALTLVQPQKVTLYQVGDLVEGASFNNFLDGIDASYCHYDGGDNPTYDAIYPDTAPGGYPSRDCGRYAPAKVISTSYAYNEHDLTPAYEQRQCHEYMKLGLMGTTILYSSGDYGVAGNGGQCIDPTTGNYTDGSYGKFNPSFPGTCPYITSVGATQVKPGVNVLTTPVSQAEEACETVIYSGGGFSNVFPLPSYQASAVKTYFAQHNPPYGADRYNNSMKTRGFPDVSANGANYVIAVDGQFALVYGTSASSPTFGSVITLVNAVRMNAGKGSVGFLNPTLYAHPQVLNDITSGGNQGCGTPGFTAVQGWDPVTGLGTPNFPKLVALYLSLP